ncbi:MAG: DUF1284 domain-containing protein [Methanobrevibacter sp.]|nr:DUF1284 domain-containing protein [Methanobrevibacter sp.]
MKLRLRGHHLLCLQGFQGYGYNEEFVLNMSHINKLRKSKDTIISLTDECDDICAHCPNLKSDMCENEKQNNIIKKMDSEVLSKLDIKKEYNALELFEEISFKFNTLDSVQNICIGCKWNKECLFYKKLI